LLSGCGFLRMHAGSRGSQAPGIAKNGADPMADHAWLPGRLAGAVAAGPPGRPLAQRICEALGELLGADGAACLICRPLPPGGC
jgi:hypothetical protein